MLASVQAPRGKRVSRCWSAARLGIAKWIDRSGKPPYDGRRLRLDTAMLRSWREDFARTDILRAQAHDQLAKTRKVLLGQWERVARALDAREGLRQVVGQHGFSRRPIPSAAPTRAALVSIVAMDRHDARRHIRSGLHAPFSGNRPGIQRSVTPKQRA